MLDLRRVDANGPHRGFELEPQLDPVPDETRQHVLEPLDEAVELGRASLQQLSTAEREQLSGEPRPRDRPRGRSPAT